MMLLENLIDEALAAHFSGWDFSWLAGRWIDSPLPWDYGQRTIRLKPRLRTAAGFAVCYSSRNRPLTARSRECSASRSGWPGWVMPPSYSKPP